MSVWDEAQKLESAEGSVWDAAVALEERPTKVQAPDEAYKQGVEIQDKAVELEMPLTDIQDNWDIINKPETVDPATSGMGTGDGRPYPLAETFFARPYLAAAEALIPGARRGLLSLVDAQLPKPEFTAPGGLADQIERAPWYKKLPEAGGWTAEKAMEFKTLGFLFKAIGLSSLFNTLGSKLASRIAGSQIAKIGGKQALLKYGGWNTFRIKVLSSIAKTAPENMAFIATWRTTEAARRGEPIGPAAVKGALWGLGFSAAVPLVTEAAKVGMNTATFEKAALKLQAKFPKLADYLAGKPEQEFIDATIESLREEATVAGVDVPSEIVFSELHPQAQNIIKGLARQYKSAWIKAAEQDAAAKRYWAVGVEKPKAIEGEIVKPSKPIEAKITPTIKPTEITKVAPAKVSIKPAPPVAEGKVEAPAKQVSEVQEKLPTAEISRKPVTVEGKTYYPVSLPTEKISVDPKKFQFKLGAKLAGGVTEALKDVEKFDPIKGGQILVWQDKAGKYWVVDGHHRVALAKKTGAENLETWVIREADGWTDADARAEGALRNLADGKGTAVDAAKLFRDSDITLEKLRKQGVPTNNAIVKQGMDMKDLSDYVFRLVVDEKLPASYAAPIGRLVKGDAQQKQVADLILEGEIDTVRQAELLAATIDTAPVLTKSEQTLFGVETTEKSLYAERAKILANVEQKLKTNKKVFGVLATQTGIIEAKGNVLAKVENLAAKEQAEEVLFMLEKLANAKGPTAEALNDATKEYAKNPTKDNLSKVTSRLLEQWTEGPARLRIPDSAGVQQLPLERAGQKAVEKPPDLFKPKEGGFVDVTPLAKVHETFMSIIEPSKAVEIAQGKDVYAEVIKAMHKADVAMIEFNENQLEHMDRTLGEWGKALSKYSNKTLELLMLSRGKPESAEAIAIRDDALQQLMKEAPELVGTRKMISRVGNFNYDYLAKVVGDEIGYIEDYFYGIYKDPRRVEKFLNHWKTTKRYTKEKKLPTVADAKAFGLDLRDPNPVNNLRSEYLAIARLEGMIDLKESLMKSGEGKYIDKTELAPIEWNKVQDPVFADVRVAPELARMINNLIATNKITRQPVLNTFRQINNFLRTVKFIGSAFHLGVEAKQSLADSGYLGFLHKKTALTGLTTGFKKSDPIFKTPEYKDYIAHGGGHRYSIDSEAQRAFSQSMEKMGKAGLVAKGVALPFQIPEKFVRWMFESYIPKVKYGKYLDTVRKQEVKLGRSLTSAEKIDIIKEQQNLYGMMNERLFGRSGTVTTLLRFKFMAPGFAEGNFRSILKAILQWGGEDGFKAHRSRSNIINSFIITACLATVGTIILTGKPPKKPETLADIRDLFKVDTGSKDKNDRAIMIDLLTYDKDYWSVFGNLATLQPGKAVEETFKRLGGMTATTWDVISDLNQMSMGRAIYDWKGDRVVEVTDPFIEKILKLSIHELKKAEPIASNVFQQARDKGVGTALAATMTLAGVRLAKSEQDKREIEILSQIWSLRDQQEALYWYLGTIKNPRDQIKKHNQTVMRILDNPITPLEVKDEYEPKLIIDVDRLMANKVFNYLGDMARLAEYSNDPKKYEKELKELRENVQKSGRWLKNFEIDESQYKKHLVVYELYHRKIIKELDPGNPLRDAIANFYAEKTIVSRKMQSGVDIDRNRRLLRKYDVISGNISEIAQRIYKTDDEEKRERYFNRIQSVLERVGQD